MSEQLYIYRWGNTKNEVGRNRLKLKGRTCRLLCRMKMNSCLIEFIDNGQQYVVSRNSLRRIDDRKQMTENGK